MNIGCIFVLFGESWKEALAFRKLVKNENFNFYERQNNEQVNGENYY